METLKAPKIALDRPTIIACATFLSASFGYLSAYLAHTITAVQALDNEKYVLAAFMVALGVISHGTPSATPERMDISVEPAKALPPVPVTEPVKLTDPRRE